jgi:hypothetical protein
MNLLKIIKLTPAMYGWSFYFLVFPAVFSYIFNNGKIICSLNQQILHHISHWLRRTLRATTYAIVTAPRSSTQGQLENRFRITRNYFGTWLIILYTSERQGNEHRANPAPCSFLLNKACIFNRVRCKSFGCGGPCRESTCNIRHTVTMLPLAVARSLPNHLQLCRVPKLSAQISEGFKHIQRSNTSRALFEEGAGNHSPAAFITRKNVS